MSLNPNEAYAEKIEELLYCYFRAKGCNLIPVRIVAELSGEANGNPVVDLVMLCRNHAVIYQPQGKVVWDKPCASPETIKQFAEWGI